MSYQSSGFFCLISLLSSLGWSQSCEDLLNESTTNVSVTAAQVVLAGEFKPPGGVLNAQTYAELPEFCRVSLRLCWAASS